MLFQASGGGEKQSGGKDNSRRLVLFETMAREFVRTLYTRPVLCLELNYGE